MTQSNLNPAPDRRSAGIGYRLSGIGNPTSDIRHPLLSPEFAPSAPPRDEFAEALREARLRSNAGNPIPQTVITAEMMENPVDGEFWRQMFQARERVRLLRR
jgi:hypothetical protein